MTEEWKILSHPFERYKISNYGRIISPRGKELKTYVHKNRAICILKATKNYKIAAYKHIGVGTEVYRYFGQGYTDGAKVYHKDGDISNNRIDNLAIARFYTHESTAGQKAHIPEIIPCVKHILFTDGYKRYAKFGMDIGNVFGNAVFESWRHLAQYQEGTSFYQYCRRITRYAFRQEFRKWQKYGSVLNLEAMGG